MPNKFRTTVGSPPGTLHYNGPLLNTSVKITVIQYNEELFEEGTFFDLDECLKSLDPGKVKWINIDGVQKTDIVEKIGKVYEIHPLTLEDIVHIDQRPKYEDYDHYLVAI